MLNKVYQLIRPRQFEVVYKDISFAKDNIIVHPEYLSICNADQRYYQGLRSESVLRDKLPMALIHEAIGRVVYDPGGEFAPGCRVVMIPNTPMEKDPIVAENYLRSSRFRASGFDGFMQEYVSMAPDRLIPLPEDMNPCTAAFTEIVSVCCHTITRFCRMAHDRRRRIAVWGDGNVGYLTSLLLHYLLPETEICVIGINEYKLNEFSFADRVYLSDTLPEGFSFDHAFECVGGGGASKAINQAIDHIEPEGTIAIMGVSEDPAPINTRMVLEKGLRIFGSSRSGREDFLKLLETYREYPDMLNYLEKIVGAVIEVRNVADAKQAFETDIHKVMGKTIMVWQQ
ncbi:MAG: zinc-binding dehydrogenase [Lachnospiraceae bacterium]|nr:zinc-binding dehydrogenase [Lachnospiraceae bacterium]